MDSSLKEMHNQHDVCNDESTLPNVVTCNSIASAHAQSIINSDNSNDNSNNKIMLRLEDMLQEMKELHNKGKNYNMTNITISLDH